jgi:hypothetical protein
LEVPVFGLLHPVSTCDAPGAGPVCITVGSGPPDPEAALTVSPQPSGITENTPIRPKTAPANRILLGIVFIAHLLTTGALGR